MKSLGLQEAQAGIKIAERNISSLGYAEDFTLLQKVKKNKEPLDECERGDLKVGLKLNIQKTKIMACSPNTSWQIDGETVETVSDFILGALKSLQMVIAAMKLKDTYSLEGKL